MKNKSGVPEWSKGAAFDAVDRRFESDPRFPVSPLSAMEWFHEGHQELGGGPILTEAGRKDQKWDF